MNDTQISKFKELYEAYRHSEDYALRDKNFAVVELNREIIKETLKNEPLLNEHLTGLIQMFKIGCSHDTFDKYLNQNVTDLARRKEISEKADKIDECGYTGAGLNAITKLTTNQLAIVKTFLQYSFTVTTIEEAVNFCNNFENENIPDVKSEIYSPWLYYINPELFPIINDSHIKFREWIEMPDDYPSCIRDFNVLNKLVGENELGLLDNFGHLFEKFSKLPTDNKVLNLNGKRLYKISHGVFKKEIKFKKAGIATLLETNKWISMGLDTKRKQATEFTNNATIGDFVYVCYGGDELYVIGKIISESKPCDPETEKLLNSDEKWTYREIEPLFFPVHNSVKEFKNDHRMFMPSGNSTFWEVPKAELNFLNKNIFIPKFGIQIIDDSLPEVSNNSEYYQNNLKDFPMNTILYGPPGTGKTFHSISHSVAIVENKTVDLVIAEERKLVKNRFDQYVKEGQIVFCTFHQSMGYEDFIEGIKPLPPNGNNAMQYDVIDGIFKKLNIEAIYQLATKTGGKKITETLDFSIKYDLFIESVQERWSKGEPVELITKSGGKISLTDVSRNNYLIFNHPGSDRSVLVSKPRLSELSSEIADLSKVNNIDKHFRSIIGGMDSTAYWASLNGIRNFQNPSETEILNVIDIDYADKKLAISNFKIENVKEICKNANKFVLIIDEINRGNIAQIFGELITLIEEDKRKGCKNNIAVTLPYSGESFEVAPNLYIIGTMNTADRSVEALDTALRRRFSFVEMEPLPEKLNAEFDGINLRLMLETINARLEILLDKDHTIGHAWLMDVHDIIGLKQKFENKIIPLLKEFFYNEIEKIGLVLGEAFFVHNTIKKIELSKFKPAAEIATEYKNKIVSKLRPINELSDKDFISIYKVNE